MGEVTTKLERAALLTLLRSAVDHSWSRVASDVAFAGSALEVWREQAGESLIPDFDERTALADALETLTTWERQGLRLVTVLDPEYPRNLLDIRELPPFLFARGELRAHDPGVSVVGSRRASDRGLAFAQAAARMLVGRELSVISGLASGIDTAAHQAALAAGGRTVAVSGTGIRNVYPAANGALQETIAQHGLLLSQFLPDAPPSKKSFPMRNAVMSGYGLATIVVEAGETSGTRIQARLAVEHGRPVILTADVARSTTWGKALVDRPGVHVISGLGELEQAVETVVAAPDQLRAALSRLVENHSDPAA